MNDNKIDFVITWVDGNDPKWQAEKSDYLKQEDPTAWENWVTGDMRYRDWGLLKYWFRGVEECAPWVNKIHFVTWGHYPKWLKVDHEKLKIVDHRDFIPEKYLPTFNSNAIELNFHRIEGLSEQFVYFNDDMFLLKKRKPEDYFKNGLPRDFAGLEPGFVKRYNLNYKPFNAMVINDHFKKNEVIKNNIAFWINIKYGIIANVKTISMLPWPRFSAIQCEHLSMNFLKRSFTELWELEEAELSATCADRFRGFREVDPWLFADWQRVKGEFVPKKPELGFAYQCGENAKLEQVCKSILRPRSSTICLNDLCETEEAFDLWANALHDAFKKRYPKKSSFEY